jgi:hypothetical protein
MTKRYAVRTLRLARHKNRRAALGRKLNMPKDKAALRAMADMMFKAGHQAANPPLLIDSDGRMRIIPK